MNRIVIAAALLLAAGTATAGKKDPVSVGGGVYMLTDQNLTIFGSADGIVAKLMGWANDYCAKKGGEAVMVDSGGSDAVAGELGKNYQLKRAAQGASGTVYFRCEGGQVATAPAAPTSKGRFLQVHEYGDVTSQVAMPDGEACAGLLKLGTKGIACSDTTRAADLPYRAILEEPFTKELLVVDSIGAMTCEAFVKGLTVSAALTIMKACAAK